MKNEYTAIIKQDGNWWVGWVEEISGVNCQQRIYEALKETLEVNIKRSARI